MERDKNNYLWTIFHFFYSHTRTTSHPDIDLEQNQEATSLQTDLVRAHLGQLRLQFWSVWVPCGDRDATQTVLQQIDLVKRLGRQYSDAMHVVDTASEARAALARGQLASFVGMEGAHPLNNSMALLRQMRAAGVKYMTLTHSCSTGFAETSVNERLVGVARQQPYADVAGLTAYGERVVLEMNRIGMIVDLSHVSAAVMRQALTVSKAPVKSFCCFRVLPSLSKLVVVSTRLVGDLQSLFGTSGLQRYSKRTRSCIAIRQGQRWRHSSQFLLWIFVDKSTQIDR
jgi:microsomal dipeptidase-like Zn-dependent dipeptidase